MIAAIVVTAVYICTKYIPTWCIYFITDGKEVHECVRCVVLPVAFDAAPPRPFHSCRLQHAEGGVLCDVWHRELLHQQGHPPRGWLQSAAAQINAVAPVGECLELFVFSSTTFGDKHIEFSVGSCLQWSNVVLHQQVKVTHDSYIDSQQIVFTRRVEL